MIYCVEDDEGIRNMLVYTLRVSGMEAEGFPDGTAFFQALDRQKPRLVMLDIMLPGMDGLEILRRLRAQADTADIPVILATARGTEYDKVTGLELGADDYLAKPFGMLEMLSRVKAVLRRTERRETEGVLRLGRLEMEPERHTVTAMGQKVQLTLKEFALLQLFLENPGRVYTRDQLLSSVWGNEYAGETRTVDVHVGTLRSKLGECGEYIRTVRGVGYSCLNNKK